MSTIDASDNAHGSVGGLSGATEFPLPPSLGNCIVVHGFLSPEECSEYIEAAERRGFRSAESEYPPSYRNNQRQVIDDSMMSARLFRQLRQSVPPTVTERSGDMSQLWALAGLNERIRICRYQSGERFNIHQDGVHYRSETLQSKLTFMIYLTDGSEFEGGDTVFFASGPGGTRNSATPDIIARVRPRLGTLIMFDHSIWHAGETVTRGIKHILRSDLLYQRVDAPLRKETHSPFGGVHHGYVWAGIRLSDGGVATCGRDSQIVIWDVHGNRRGVLIGHQQSVLGLVEIQPGVIASISRDRHLRYWDISKQTCTFDAAAHSSAVLSIAQLPDGRIVTGGADHEIRIWTTTGEQTHSMRGHEGWVWSLASDRGDFLVSASEDGYIKIWKTPDNSCVAEIHSLCPLRTIAIRSCDNPDDGFLLAVGDAEGLVSLWNVKSQAVVSIGSLKAHTTAVRRIRFLSNGNLATCGEDNLMRVWDCYDYGVIYERRHANFVTDVIELPGGSLLSCGYDGCRII